ncbi:MULTISPECIES: Na(+)-translocating NADH-quinone reductase subunit C [Leeuwenhoekiella]|uniref:Na(+)-translocating NADH-quinone reductase subunit C n=1 Tax=Leeuwenhoekiella palythoae TaxID=573501 RepID=A0A1M5ZGW7_9FLAO|nr:MULTISPECIES: Na(+)-translocating NADH-quinone reductase subunit C [Leeuwenhoekiella]MEE3148974.1 Na(+)-translocating NADH-quinone reductase subunit C [Bacteroidota bacterium]RXG27678.1 Na+-transporting NADH:ubiquinone oxidoreductase subunit C [Leeuwenhoekiella palythoae]UBZ09583.1 Na(+)-translocating NADH-quinone reductase subunit C [Leeuwenhoekiella palythoae]SHI23525.1 Na+-transporting NADH:ubiquinone oxidoreductase subunit C [Leeuwenhoekiella palythoae]|tara:strand:- start:446 stop:1180 length:735 start_codon:yes stop_codon:yes gene_type:complete
MANTDKNSYTIIFAIVMVLVVGALLAFTASSLKPTITENERFEKQQNILYAMGINENVEGSVNFIPTAEVEAEFSKYIKQQLVIQNGEVKQDSAAYLIDLKGELSKDMSERKLPLFVGEKEGKDYYIIPLYGKGLWDAIWGFVALDADYVVQGVFFDHKGETPGLGANIKERYFMDDFTGEEIMNGTQYEGITVAKGNNDPLNDRKDDGKVDAIAGATITGNGVTAMINSTVKLYIPYLKDIKL